MGSPLIEVSRISHPPSVVDEEEELRGILKKSPHISPQYSERGGDGSHDGSSGFRDRQYAPLQYPSEIHDPDIPDGAYRVGHEPRPPDLLTRSNSSQTRGGPAEAGLHRSPRELGSDDDSTVEYIRTGDPRPMPRDGRVYYNPYGGYTQSSSSGAGSYHPGPGGQMVHYAAAPHTVPMPYPQHYPQIASPSTIYAPQHPGFAPYPSHPGPPMASPYSPQPYGMMPYPPQGYFPPQYPPHYGLPSPIDTWRGQSPPLMPGQPTSAPTSAGPASDSERSRVESDDIAKKIEAIMLAHTEKESQGRIAREEAKYSAEKAAADAIAAKVERELAEKRIRDETLAQALKATEDAKKADADRTLREQQIREEAAAAALKKAAEAAEAQAAKAASDKKIAEEAAAAAKTEAEKKAAEEAAKAKEESEKKQKEADEKLKEAEEAAKKATAEAEDAKKAAEALKPKEKKAPIRFHDAVGRKFNFPFEICCRWRGMETLINQAFQHVEVVGGWIQAGNYDLVGPTGEIILPSLWDAIIEPDWQITMHMWPMPEEKKEDDMFGDDGAMVVPPDIDMSAIFGDSKGRSDKAKGSSKRSRSKPGGLAAWMMGGSSGSRNKDKGGRRP